MPKFNYKTLKSKYQNFHYPTYDVLVDGREIQKRFDLVISDITVDLSTEFKSSYLVFSIDNLIDSNGKIKKNLAESTIKVGKKIKAKLGYGNKLKTVFEGYIMSVNLIQNRFERPEIIVECFDATISLMNSKKHFKFKSANTASSAVSEILNKYRGIFSKLRVSRNSEKLSEIIQSNQTDYEFIVDMAKSIGFEFFVERGQAIFRKLAADRTVLIDIKANELLLDFSKSIDLSGQIGNVIIKSYHKGDPKKHELSKIAKVSTIGSGSKQASDISKIISNKNSVEEYMPMAENKEIVSTKAKSMLLYSSLDFVKVELSVIGIPEILPGYFVNIKSNFDQKANKYYITNVTHKANSNGFETLVKAKANKIWQCSIKF